MQIATTCENSWGGNSVATPRTLHSRHTLRAPVATLTEGTELERAEARAAESRRVADANPDDRSAAELAEMQAGQASSARQVHDTVKQMERRVQRLVAQLGDAANRAAILVVGRDDTTRIDSMIETHVAARQPHRDRGDLDPALQVS